MTLRRRIRLQSCDNNILSGRRPARSVGARRIIMHKCSAEFLWFHRKSFKALVHCTLFSSRDGTGPSYHFTKVHVKKTCRFFTRCR